MPFRSIPRRLLRPPAAAAFIAIAGLALLTLFPLTVRTAEAQRAILDRVMRDTVLENGLHVIVLKNSIVPLATMQVVVRNGAFTQLAEGDEGIPHLLEHMLFKAFETSISGASFGSRAADIGATYNGTTSDETVTYYLTLPSRNMAGGMKLLGDLMRSPSFTNAALDTEKLVVRGELERAVANPLFVLNFAVDQRVWGDGFRRKNTIGNVLSIQGASSRQLRDIYRKYYVPNNAALVVTGDVNEEEVFAMAARHFRGWSRGDDPFAGEALPPMPPMPRYDFVAVTEASSDITVMVRWHGPSVREDAEATFAADVFSSLVNQPTSSMQRRLVDSGLFRSVWLNYQTLNHVGPITLTATTDTESYQRAVFALQDEMRRFSSPDYFSDEELAIAKKRQMVASALEFESPSGLASTIGWWWSVAGLDYYRDYADRLAEQSREDLQRYIARYVTGRPKVIGLLVDPAQRRTITPAIEATMAGWGGI